MAVEIEGEVGVVARLGKRAAVADAAKLAVVWAAVAETARIAAVHRWKMAAEVVEIVPVALPRPSAEVAVPSSWRRPTAPETSARASVVTAAACRVVEEDARPLTSAEEEVEECSPVGNHRMAAAVRAAAVDDPLVVLESRAVAEAARPFRDASRDAGDDGPVGERSRSNSASVAVPTVVHRRTVDAVCPLGSVGFVRPKAFLLHCRVSHL